MNRYLDRAVSRGLLRSFDNHFARLMAELGGGAPALQLAAALVSLRSGEGHVCLPLAQVAGQAPFPEVDEEIKLPDLPHLRQILLESDVVGELGDYAPLILDEGNRLYLGRYWRYEQDLADALLDKAYAEETVDLKRLRDALNRFFPSVDESNEQKVAAAIAVLRRFAVISGGPGTGKTYTVAAILSLLSSLSERQLRIALAAPTGKAAARLTESIRAAKAALPLDLFEADAIPEQTQTLHRLLGARSGGSFRYGPDNPLHLDLLVVDEASMIDLPLMARLAGALPRHARLILLGDRDQLASVEAGYVLGDICGPGSLPSYSAEMRKMLKAVCGFLPSKGDGSTTAAMNDSVAVLQKSRRFDSAGAIGRLALTVRNGDAEGTEAVLKSESKGSDSIDQSKVKADMVNHGSIESDPFDFLADDAESLAQRAAERYAGYLGESSPAAALAAFERFRVLCALRDGELGVRRLNERIELTLARLGLIDTSNHYYAGRPIMVTRNDYQLGLFNGDVGLVWPDEMGRPRAWLRGEDGLRSLSPSRLPQHETVYAMTVHKSQGSEFDEILLVLPDEDAPLLSRELFYTGVTRARSRVGLRMPASLLYTIVERRVQRDSALREKLWSTVQDG